MLTTQAPTAARPPPAPTAEARTIGGYGGDGDHCTIAVAFIAVTATVNAGRAAGDFATAITVLADGQSMAVDREGGDHAACIIHADHTTASTAARSTPTAEARTIGGCRGDGDYCAIAVAFIAVTATVNAGRRAGDFTAAIAVLAGQESKCPKRKGRRDLTGCVHRYLA